MHRHHTRHTLTERDRGLERLVYNIESSLDHKHGIIRTTVSNYEARKTGFSLAILPKAFQDTILVARILKVPYVWIDSICIIQDGDSGQDWLAEASKMSQYYQQSLLTLAVTNINNETGSFLEQRPSSIANQLVRLPYRDINGRSKGHFYIQKREKEAYSEYVSTVRRSPLLVRGWVLQEWFLSRRIIYYTPSQLYFECKTNPARNECNETAHEGVKLGTAFQMRPREWVLSSILEKEKPLRELWCEIIELYSGLALTMPNKDRIRAIAGIAEETRQMILLQQKNGSSVNNTRAEYVAGLWLQDLHHGLLWEQVTDDIAQPSKCGSSSWSWASLLCPVKWQDTGRNDYNACKLLRVLCTQDHRHDSSQGNELIIEEDANLDRGSGFFLSDLWSPRTIESAAINSPSECFNITNASASITLKGRCKHVLLGKTLNRSEKEMLYSFTDCATPSTRAWKAICNLDSPQTPIGWASIESSATNEQLSFYDAIAVVALHVSTRKGLSGGIQFGRIGFTHEVYNVLFLDNVDGFKYKRIGVGRVFEQGFFASTPGQIFELI